MNTRQAIMSSLIVCLLGIQAASRADDIDIYSSSALSGVNTPNVMFLVDSSANSDGAFGGCTYWDGSAPALNGAKSLGNEQCALVNIVHNLPTRSVTNPTTGVVSQVALVNVGLTTANGHILDLTPVDDNAYTGTFPGTAGMTNRQAIIFAFKGYVKNPGQTNQGMEMQEAWAYLTGGNKGASGTANNVGSISGLTFSSGVAATGCMHNYLITIGATPNSAHTTASNGDGASPLNLLTAVNNALLNNSITAAKAAALSTALPATINPENPWGVEWARFMYDTDANTTASGNQGITSYSVILEGGLASMDTYWKNVANYGGGKTFTATDYNSLYISILKILNEVQAINSVFSSSSLPVSVNAQGTFLNQIYMGMFRPDAQANPRWVGNLKQYQFIYNQSTGTLSLGDSLALPALSSSGTGFISPNAISFWTCSNLSVNPYATSTNPVNLTSAQIALLGKNNQNCTDPTGGFWVNDPTSATAIAQGYDLPDGERVERGGAGQQIRQNFLTVNYTTSPAAPRNLYTYCPSGAGCIAALTDPSNAFATTNAAITGNPGAFGSTLTANVSKITRFGTTATVTTTGAHGFSTGDSVTIANATDAAYNGTFTVTVVDATHFTYPVVEDPPNPSTGTYTSQKAGATFSLSSLTRSGNTVTVTTTAATGFPNGTTVVISGVTPTAYNGSFVITCLPAAATCGTQFTYTLNEKPATAAGTGTVAPVTTAVATSFTNATCTTSLSVNIDLWNAATPGVSRTLGSTTATVTTTASIGGGSGWQKSGTTFKCPITITGVVDSNGTSVPEYNATFAATTTAYLGTNTFTISGFAVSPITPATVTGATAAGATGMQSITSLTYVDIAATTTATVTATTAAAHGYAVGDTVSIGGTGPTHEANYLGNFTVTAVPSATTFQYVINTNPASPATAITGSQITATRSSGFLAANMTALINWVRGQDNKGDETGPGGTVTIRPSVHGDVLHSRPTVLNYGSYTVTITGTSDSGTIRTATASAADVTTIAGSGATPVVTFANTQACPVTVASGTTFTYSITNCGNAGAQTAHVGSKVVVFYGDNGGVYHAVNGNQTMLGFGVGPGDELWGFIPRESFIKLNRQRDNSPALSLPSTPPGITPTPAIKDYFVDGAPGVYQYIDSTTGNTLRAVLYLSMRRGGNFIYAIDVTNPAQPTVLWRVDSTSAGMGELGQTWSQPKVAWVKGYSTNIDPNTGVSAPVVIFGGGYDTNEDNEPEVAPDAHGRAIYVLDALTGALVWKATTSGGGPTSCGVGTACQVNGMDYAIPSDITLVDRNYDGLIDRLYAADLGGNIWRVDLEPGCNGANPCANAAPSSWNVHRLAALGCFSSVCVNPSNPTQRKFFYPPEVIFATNTYNYDAVVAGSGDREHPLYVSTSTQRYNRVFLLKDTYIGDNATGMPVITMAGTNPLFDATTTPWDGSLNGYYISLAAGEKVVNAPLVVAGLAYLGTNTPNPPGTLSCNAQLGIAKGYQLSPFAGTYKSVIYDGGGLPPSPVAGVVNVVVGDQVKQVPFIIGGANPDCTGSADCKSALGGQKPVINVPTTRHRTYWYQKGK